MLNTDTRILHFHPTNIDNSIMSTSYLNGSASETNATFAVLEALLGGTAGESLQP